MDVSLIDIICQRVSCRTYSAKPIEVHKISRLKDFLQSNLTGPFGTTLRFELLDLTEVEKAEVRKLVTYGVIQGGRYYIPGIVIQDSRSLRDFGYAMERNILEATAMGLGTCWLGRTFNRTGFARRMQTQENEIIPAITPVGYPKEEKSMLERLFRLSAGSDKRKAWKELFFAGVIDYPLSQIAKSRSYIQYLRIYR